MLKMGLSALADETRLQIIDLLAKEGPLNAKEIQSRLDLSQSAASRHINQLAGSGYLKVEKISGVKYLSNSSLLEAKSFLNHLNIFERCASFFLKSK